MKKMYIAVLDEVGDFMVPTLVAHSVINAHMHFVKPNRLEDVYEHGPYKHPDYVDWLENSFKKVTLRVNRKQFDKIAALPNVWLGHENTTLDGEPSCIVVCPMEDEDRPNVLKYTTMWAPKPAVDKPAVDVDLPENKYLDIFAKPGTTVRFINKNGYETQREHAAEILNTTDVYTVKTIEVGRSSSDVLLEEHPDHRFNTVMFEHVGDYDRFDPHGDEFNNMYMYFPLEKVFSLSNLKPADVVWIGRNISKVAVQQQLVHEIEKFISQPLTSIAELDHAWSTGVALSEFAMIIDYTKTGTNTCAAFSAGVQGIPFLEGLKDV